MTLAQEFGTDSNRTILLILGVTVIAAVVLAMLIWQLATTYRAKALLAREHAYRKFAEGAADTQAKTAEALHQIHTRLAAVEKLLRDVG